MDYKCWRDWHDDDDDDDGGGGVAENSASNKAKVSGVAIALENVGYEREMGSRTCVHMC